MVVKNIVIFYPSKGFSKTNVFRFRGKTVTVRLTCDEVLRVEQFAGNFSFQLIGFVSIWRQASLPVNPTLA